MLKLFGGEVVKASSFSLKCPGGGRLAALPPSHGSDSRASDTRDSRSPLRAGGKERGALPQRKIPSGLCVLTCCRAGPGLFGAQQSISHVPAGTRYVNAPRRKLGIRKPLTHASSFRSF